jgi:tetratricopeptide (TPR) repeat protein
MKLRLQIRVSLTIVMACSFLSGLATIVSAEQGIQVYQYQRLKRMRKPAYVPEMKAGVDNRNEEALNLAAQGRYDEAIDLFLKVINRIKQKAVKNPEFAAEVYNNLAQTLYEKGMYSSFGLPDNNLFVQAADYAKKSFEAKEDYWQAYVTLGNVYYRMKEYEKVDAAYSKAEELMDKDSRDYKRLVTRHNLVRRILKMNREKAGK